MKYYHTLQMNLDPVELVSEDIRENRPCFDQMITTVSELFKDFNCREKFTKYDFDIISPQCVKIYYITLKGNEGELTMSSKINDIDGFPEGKTDEDYRATSSYLDGKLTNCEEYGAVYSLDIIDMLDEANE